MIRPIPVEVACLALPGDYTVELSMFHNGEEKLLAGPVEFTAKVLNNSTLTDTDRNALVAFQQQISDLYRVMDGTDEYFDDLKKRTTYIQQAIVQTNGATVEMKNKAQKMQEELQAIEFLFEGTPAKASSEEVPPEIMSLSSRLQEVVWGMWSTTSAPTKSMKMNYEILLEEFPKALDQLNNIGEQIDLLNKELDELKASYTPGRIPKM